MLATWTLDDDARDLHVLLRGCAPRAWATLDFADADLLCTDPGPLDAEQARRYIELVNLRF